jgi:hypothetical protein
VSRPALEPEETAGWRYAEMIFDTLAQHGRLTKWGICEHSGLTLNQFLKGKTVLTRWLQEVNGQPLGLDSETWEYFLPSTITEATPWQLNRLSDAVTRSRTIEVTLRTSAKAFPDHADRLLFWAKQMSRMQEDCSDVAMGLGNLIPVEDAAP